MKRLSFLYSYKIIALIFLLGAMSFESLAQRNKPTNGLTPADLKKIKGLETKIKDDSLKLQQLNTQLESIKKENKTLEATNAQLSLQLKNVNTENDSHLWIISAGVLGLLFGFLVGKILTKPQTQIVEKVTEKIIERPTAFTTQEKEQWQTQVAVLEKEKKELLQKIAQLEAKLASVQKDITSTVIPSTPTTQLTTDKPQTRENLPANSLRRYANSAINKGEGFEIRDLKEQLRYEYFALDLNEVEGIGTFYVVDNPETQEAAIQNFDSILAVTCEYSELPNGRKKVVVLEAGKLQKDNQLWRIMQKMRIRFE
jgi:DNA repair exonuclease SbcCD ATPase subunit